MLPTTTLVRSLRKVHARFPSWWMLQKNSGCQPSRTPPTALSPPTLSTNHIIAAAASPPGLCRLLSASFLCGLVSEPVLSLPLLPLGYLVSWSPTRLPREVALVRACFASKNTNKRQKGLASTASALFNRYWPLRSLIIKQ
jgi:hypothetical protein